MTKPPLTRLFACALPVVFLSLLGGCAEPINTQTQYLYPTTGSTMPRQPMAKMHAARRPVERPVQRPVVPPVEPALPTAPSTPHLKSTPPTLRDRTGAPTLMPTGAESKPAAKTKPVSAPTPVAENSPNTLAGSGDFTIDYVNGAITKVSIERKTGNRDLDRKSTTWIWAKFRVRPGATGQSALTLTWREDHDRPTPKFHPI